MKNSSFLIPLQLQNDSVIPGRYMRDYIGTEKFHQIQKQAFHLLKFYSVRKCEAWRNLAVIDLHNNWWEARKMRDEESFCTVVGR